MKMIKIIQTVNYFSIDLIIMKYGILYVEKSQPIKFKPKRFLVIQMK